MFNFSLKFDDKGHSLNAEDGISINLISDLLKSLYEAIDLDEQAKCTLSNIRGNCYALDFSSESENQLTRFKIVHKNIQDLPISGLTSEQRKYAKTLKKIMDGKYYIEAFDENKNRIASIKKINNDGEVKYYYTHQTVHGLLSLLGGNSINSETKYIRIDGYPHRINISKDLDMLLKPFYGSEKLAVKVRVKHSVDSGSILKTEMVHFTRVERNSLSENLRKEGFIDLNIMKNNDITIDGIIDAIYGNR